MRIAIFALALTLASAVQAAECDQYWTAFKGAPLGVKLDQPVGMSDEAFRWRTGRDLFAATAEQVGGKTPEQVKAEGQMPMVVSLKLSLSDKLLSCYQPDETETDVVFLDESRAFEAEMPAERRAEIVAAFRLKE